MRKVDTYDILQVNHGEGWEDYATLKDADDIRMGTHMVGNPKYRIISGHCPDRGTVLLGGK